MLIPKLPEIKESTSIKWHMIGHIQSRKANLVMDHFDYVHSIDSLKIAQRLQRRGEETGRQSNRSCRSKFRAGRFKKWLSGRKF